MTTNKMHSDQMEIDNDLVRNLVDTQFPAWANIPLTPVDTAGTENALYRLGDKMVVRMPYRPGKEEQVDKLHHWLPKLAPRLSLPIPVPIAKGAPTPEYPSSWSVCCWLSGTHATLDRLSHPIHAANELAKFIHALQKLSPTGGPVPGAHNFYRGVSLKHREAMTRQAIAASKGLLDHKAVIRAWEADRSVPAWDKPPVWLHGDLMPGNLLATNCHLSGVIDWGGLGVGDPATDLLPAWNLFLGQSRAAFRDAISVDEATWARGRGLALSIALVALPYYLKTNPVIVRWARAMIDEVLADHKYEK